MQNLLIVTQQVGILFILMGLGVFCRHMKFVDDKNVKGMVNVLFMIVTPCLIVHCFQRPFDSSMLGGLGIAFAIAILTHFIAIVLSKLLVHSREKRTECVLRLATVFSNAGFMGIPVEQAVLGNEGVFYGAVYVAVFNLMIWSWGVLTMGGGANRKMMLVNPGTIGVACGLPLFLLSVKLPEIIGRPVAMMSDINTPLAMVVIGYYLLADRFKAVFRSAAALIAVVLRLIVIPLVLVAALYPVRHLLDRTMMLALVTAAASPVAAMATLFAVQYDRDVDMSVGMVTGTTILSVITMPVVIAFAMEVL